MYRSMLLLLGLLIGLPGLSAAGTVSYRVELAGPITDASAVLNVPLLDPSLGNPTAIALSVAGQAIVMQTVVNNCPKNSIEECFVRGTLSVDFQANYSLGAFQMDNSQSVTDQCVAYVGESCSFPLAVTVTLAGTQQINFESAPFYGGTGTFPMTFERWIDEQFGPIGSATLTGLAVEVVYTTSLPEPAPVPLPAGLPLLAGALAALAMLGRRLRSQQP